jgi:PhzF family phenazine biosynthesis protein
MFQRPFRQVDVFTGSPYLGNPLAVVHEAAGLTEADMLRFARWTNLSETTFLMPPSPEAAANGADYQVRIFTPAYEMPFAGHPTLGSCHAWLEAGGVPRNAEFILQQCPVGLVRIRRSVTDSSSRLAFAAPPLNRREPTAAHRNALAQALGLQPQQILDAQHLHNGPQHFGFLVDSADTVFAVQPDALALAAALKDAGVTGVGLAAVRQAPTSPGLISRSNREARAFASNSAQGRTGSADTGPELEIRFFAIHTALVEDPVTGSFNASMAQWLIGEGYAPTHYVAAQGSCIGFEGRVHIAQDAQGQVWVGGDCVTCIEGQVKI